MEKPTQKALDLFAEGFPDDDRAEQKKMFGMPAGFVNGNMFYGVFANGVVFRVGEDRRDSIADDHDGVEPFEPMPGRPWREYIHVDADTWNAGDIAGWVDEALEFTAKMPPK